LVAIARIQRTHGRRGEVSAEPLTDFQERFVPGLKVIVTAREARRTLRIEAARFHKDRVLLKFEGVGSITEAEALRGALVQVPESERFPLPAGQVYLSDLMGCSVWERGEILGTVVGWQETGTVPLLQVDSDGSELLIPFTPAICCSVDIAGKRILVNTPDGLRGLNSAAGPRRVRRRKTR
jgi:16S rRNA processing protein RimM